MCKIFYCWIIEQKSSLSFDCNIRLQKIIQLFKMAWSELEILCWKAVKKFFLNCFHKCAYLPTDQNLSKQIIYVSTHSCPIFPVKTNPLWKN